MAIIVDVLCEFLRDLFEISMLSWPYRLITCFSELTHCTNGMVPIVRHLRWYFCLIFGNNMYERYIWQKPGLAGWWGGGNWLCEWWQGRKGKSKHIQFRSFLANGTARRSTGLSVCPSDNWHRMSHLIPRMPHINRMVHLLVCNGSRHL